MTPMTPRSLTRAALAACLVGTLASLAGAHSDNSIATIPVQKGKVSLASGS